MSWLAAKTPNERHRASVFYSMDIPGKDLLLLLYVKYRTHFLVYITYVFTIIRWSYATRRHVVVVTQVWIIDSPDRIIFPSWWACGHDKVVVSHT